MVIRGLGVVLAAMAYACAGTAVSNGAVAATFTVNSTNDLLDATRDGQCDTGSQVRSAEGVLVAECTLRAAITESNGTEEVDSILFNIPPAACHPQTQVCTIFPDVKLGNSGLPGIHQPVVIDGYSQPGSSPNTLRNGNNAVIRVHIDGKEWYGRYSVGLYTVSGGENAVVIKGLAVTRFQTGIAAYHPFGGGRIEGNFIGVYPSDLRVGRNEVGVDVYTDHPNRIDPFHFVTIGGRTPAARNLISGNVIGCRVTNRTQIIGNYVGTDRSGRRRLGAVTQYGIWVKGQLNTIGGDSAGSANVLAFNNIAGIAVARGDPEYTGKGLYRYDDGNVILQNSIFSNGEIGIDVGDDGRTANDTDDLDRGPNGRQNFPVLSSATRAGNSTIILGRLNSLPDREFRLLFFSSSQGGGPQRYLGETSITTNAEGNAPFRFDSAELVTLGHVVTATATGERSGTSEFSNPRLVK